MTEGNHCTETYYFLTFYKVRFCLAIHLPFYLVYIRDTIKFELITHLWASLQIPPWALGWWVSDRLLEQPPCFMVQLLSACFYQDSVRRDDHFSPTTKSLRWIRHSIWKSNPKLNTWLTWCDAPNPHCGFSRTFLKCLYDEVTKGIQTSALTAQKPQPTFGNKKRTAELYRQVFSISLNRNERRKPRPLLGTRPQTQEFCPSTDVGLRHHLVISLGIQAELPAPRSSSSSSLLLTGTSSNTLTLFL